MKRITGVGMHRGVIAELQRRFRRIVNLFLKIETDLDLNILRVSTRTRY